MGLTLHQHGHTHSGSSSHGHSHNEENINVRAAFIHVLGDFLQSFGVFVAAIVIYFKVRFHSVSYFKGRFIDNAHNKKIWKKIC